MIYLQKFTPNAYLIIYYSKLQHFFVLKFILRFVLKNNPIMISFGGFTFISLLICWALAEKDSYYYVFYIYWLLVFYVYGLIVFLV